jgi:hypothetical protein
MKVEAFYRKRKQLSTYLPQSERHKLKVERRPQTTSTTATNSPAVLEKSSNDLDKSSSNDLMDSPVPSAVVVAASNTPTLTATGKRRPSDQDSEADMSLSGDTAGPSEPANGGCEATQQPPMKRSNTDMTNNEMTNGSGNGVLEVS